MYGYYSRVGYNGMYMLHNSLIFVYSEPSSHPLELLE